MSTRYPRDESDYRMEPRQGARRDTRERDPRETRAEPARERRIPDDRMDTRDIRMSDPMDTRPEPRIDSRDRMDIRPDQRAPAARLMDPRAERVTMDSRPVDPDSSNVLMQDSRPTDPYYRNEVRSVPARSAYARDEREYDVPTRNRPLDQPMGRERDPLRPEYTEYFCPGDGIEREVIQHEICKYLGRDATLRIGRSSEGRTGYWVKAYRPFTTAMEQSLREETIRWMRERERRARQGRSQGMAYTDWQAIRSEDRIGSYAEMQARQESRQLYRGDMDLDDDEYSRAPPVHRDLDPRPIPAGGRVALPVTSAYAPDSGYPAQYTISSNQPGYNSGQPGYYQGTEREQPRTFGGGGNTPPPPINRTTPTSGYQPPGYPSRTGPPVTAPSIPAAYDSRRDMMGGGYSTNYDTARRHGR